MKNNNLKNKLTLVVLGRSGSGKGTQANFLVRRLGKGAIHFSSGEFYRKLAKKTSPTTVIVRRIMERGEIFPSWLPIYAWLKGLIEKEYAERHIVFDGAPRKIEEAKLLDRVIGWYGRPLPVCIYMYVSEKEVTKRLLARGRADDTLVSIRNRLRYFEKDVRLVFNYYRRNGRLVRISGEGSRKEIAERINAVLAKRLGTQWPK